MSISKKKQPIRLQDIASDAEVSVATVSLALRDDPSITEATRRRVMEAKKRLGYSPLRKRTKSIPEGASASSGCKYILYCLVGFPVRKIQYADFLNGVMHACNQRKIRLEVRSIQHEDMLGTSDIAFKHVDGVILTGDFQKSTTDFFMNAKRNVILLGNYPFVDTHRVEIDVFGMGEMTAKRLVEEEHKNVVHLIRMPNNYYERQFLMGVRDGLESRNMPPPKVLRMPDMADSVAEVAKQIREMQPEITAITSHAANIVEACIMEIRDQENHRGKRVPMGYAVGLISNEQSTKEIKILDSGAERCGWLAVERVCQLYDHPSPFPYASVLPAAGWRKG